MWDSWEDEKKYAKHLSGKCLRIHILSSYQQFDSLGDSLAVWPFFPKISSQLIFPQFSLYALTPNEQMKRNAWFLSSFPVTYVFRRLICVLKTPPFARSERQTLYPGRLSPRKNIIMLPHRILLRTNRPASEILPLGKAIDLLCVNVGTNGSQ